jgi:hypothetical protein
VVRLGLRGSEGRVKSRRSRTRRWPVSIVSGLIALLLLASCRAGSEDHETSGEALRKLLAQHTCPCGCGSRLPGGGKDPECFGCSVGKSEASFIREELAAGRRPIDIAMDLNDSALIEIFADYTDAQLPDTWSRTQRAAAELQQHRVVLRAPGVSAEARRALQLAECARMANRYWQIRDALIEHSGPWGAEALLALGAAAGLDRNATRHCLDEIEVGAQLDKDRQHAEQRGIRSFPTISIDRTAVEDTDRAIRRAIRQSMLEKSL